MECILDSSRHPNHRLLTGIRSSYNCSTIDGNMSFWRDRENRFPIRAEPASPLSTHLSVLLRQHWLTLCQALSVSPITLINTQWWGQDFGFQMWKLKNHEVRKERSWVFVGPEFCIRIVFLIIQHSSIWCVASHYSNKVEDPQVWKCPILMMGWEEVGLVSQGTATRGCSWGRPPLM